MVEALHARCLVHKLETFANSYDPQNIEFPLYSRALWGVQRYVSAIACPKTPALAETTFNHKVLFCSCDAVEVDLVLSGFTLRLGMEWS